MLNFLNGFPRSVKFWGTVVCTGLILLIAANLLGLLRPPDCTRGGAATPSGASAVETTSTDAGPKTLEKTHGEFSAAEAAELRARISSLSCAADRFKTGNQIWDNLFKSLILVFTIFGAGITAAVASRKDSNDQFNGTVPTSWLVISAMLTTAVGVMGTFAATTFDFPRRQEVWERKHVSLQGCLLILEMGQPRKLDFLTQLYAIQLWNDNTPRSELTASCIQPVPGAAKP